jgi:hypothetical protein
MARDGRLPAALEAVSRQMEFHEHRSGPHEKADAAVLASLLAFGSDPDLSKALFKLLSLDHFPTADSASERPKLADELQAPVLPNGDSPPLPDAFRDCRRSRDGPF